MKFFKYLVVFTAITSGVFLALASNALVYSSFSVIAFFYILLLAVPILSPVILHSLNKEKNPSQKLKILWTAFLAFIISGPLTFFIVGSFENKSAYVGGNYGLLILVFYFIGASILFLIINGIFSIVLYMKDKNRLQIKVENK